MNELHVYPLNDTQEHEVDSSFGCPCEPYAIAEAGGIVWVHNSFDGREWEHEGKGSQLPK